MRPEKVKVVQTKRFFKSHNLKIESTLQATPVFLIVCPNQKDGNLRIEKDNSLNLEMNPDSQLFVI